MTATTANQSELSRIKQLCSILGVKYKVFENYSENHVVLTPNIELPEKRLYFKKETQALHIISWESYVDFIACIVTSFKNLGVIITVLDKATLYTSIKYNDSGHMYMLIRGKQAKHGLNSDVVQSAFTVNLILEFFTTYPKLLLKILPKPSIENYSVSKVLYDLDKGTVSQTKVSCEV